VGEPDSRKQSDAVRDMVGLGDYVGGSGGAGGAGFPGGFGGFPGGTRVRVEDLGDLGGLLGGLFGGVGGAGRASRRRQARGADLETEVRIPFEEAMTGTTVPVRIRGASRCPTCGGTGAEPGTSPVVC